MPFNNFSIKSSSSNDKLFFINVKTIDAEMNFNIGIRSKGIDLFELVCRALGLRETWYFGLLYSDSFNNRLWLKMKKKIKLQCICKDRHLNFDFLVKFYPEDVSEEIIQSITRHAFFLQVKQAILSTEIYCPPEATVLLASYAIQAKYGDFSEEIVNSGILTKEELLPQRVVNQFQMTADMWMDQILEWYMKIRGMEREDAETEYLRIVQDLEMYCIQYFKITNNQNTNLWLGISNHGLNIYEHDNKLTPKISFQWNEIKGLYFKDKKFIVNLIDKKSPKFVCLVDREKTCKTIMDLCIGNHELFLRRRRPDTMEVQQMKIQTKDERLKKQMEREKFLREKEEVERIKNEQDEKILQLHEQFRNMQLQLASCQEALCRSEESADLLAEKVNLAEEEANLIRQKANEALNEKNLLELAALKTTEEKLLMEKRKKYRLRLCVDTTALR